MEVIHIHQLILGVYAKLALCEGKNMSALSQGGWILVTC